jgi:hypothetical protein
MIWIILGVLIVIATGLALMLVNAIDGYEDAQGFHRGKR